MTHSLHVYPLSLNSANSAQRPQIRPHVFPCNPSCRLGPPGLTSPQPLPKLLEPQGLPSTRATRFYVPLLLAFPFHAVPALVPLTRSVIPTLPPSCVE
jgi:hypothetical protein